MNNFKKTNQPENFGNIYYPQPLFLDEETGKITVQEFQNTTSNSFQDNNTSQQNQQNNTHSNNKNQPNSFLNGFNSEKLMSMLKNGNSNDMLSSLFSNGMKGQNPMNLQALSKLLHNENKSSTIEKSSKASSATFEEM